ncbi:MAG TPA: hypothetical protein VKA34_08200 [Balneolales bacterium]|nr:hypothetical protein [Balneolales bacterium]
MTRTEKIEAFLSELKTEIDVLSMVDVDNIESYDDVYYQIEENGGFDEEIIYYANAIEYLANNDASLQESCSIAAEMGYTTENLNSELLASLLYSQEIRNEFEELRDEIEDFLSEVEDDEEEEEEDDE